MRIWKDGIKGGIGSCFVECRAHECDNIKVIYDGLPICSLSDKVCKAMCKNFINISHCVDGTITEYTKRGYFKKHDEKNGGAI
jgi:hypothetical protein